MPKAIAFEPEQSFERFIHDFLLEPNPVEVKQVRQSLAAHKEMQARLARLNDEIDFLRRIAALDEAYIKAKCDATTYAHAKVILERDEAAETLAQVEARLARENEKYTVDLSDLEKATADLAQVTALLNEVRLEAGRDAQFVQLERVERQKKELNASIANLREAKQTAAKRLKDRATHWSNWLRRGESLGLDGLNALLHVDNNHLSALSAGAEQDTLDALPFLANRFNEIFRATGELLQPVRHDIAAAEQKLQEIARDLEAIDQQQTPGAFTLFAALKQKLARSAQIPEQLCRLIEVKPREERWWNALELFLGRNRFAVIVSGEDYPTALTTLAEIPLSGEGEALVNPKEALAIAREPKPDSLATKVEVADLVARAFVNHLLGDVICVETVEELDRIEAGRAITPKGIFKQVPTRRRLREQSDRRFTLGRQGLERMKRDRLKGQVQVRAQHDALLRKLADVNAWLDSAKHAGLGDATLPDRSAELSQLPELMRQYEVAKETANLLRTSERATRLDQLAKLDARKAELDGKVAVLTETNKGFLVRRQQLVEAANTAREAFESRSNASDISRQTVPIGISDEELEQFVVPLRSKKVPWRTRIENAQQRSSGLALAATERRTERNTVRQNLADTRDENGSRRHPHWLEQDVAEESNERWQQRLNLLVSHELDKHQQLAAEKKREWEERLKDQVLDKLNERLKDAESTVRQLRTYLDREVNGYRYRISQKRDSAMSTVWHLLDTG
jgi:hypothetical protein